MDLNDAGLAKTLECPVCLDVFDDPKLLICGHTVCQKCVNKVVAARRNGANARQERACIKCPECNKETDIPPEGLATNYRLVDLVCRAQKSLMDVYACNGCGKHAPVAEMFTCESCQETLNCKPLWICALCMCNKATRQQVEEACQGIANISSLADIHIDLTMSHLDRAFRETELISQLLNQQKRGFGRLEARVKSADNNLAQEDLAASLQEATDLEQKFEQASACASEARRGFEGILRDYREKLEDLFPEDQVYETAEPGGSGTLRNNFDLSIFDDGQEVIVLNECCIDAIPDLTRFTKLQLLDFRWNRISLINDSIIHTTLTELYLNGNKITEIRGLEALANLEIFKANFNRLRKIEGLTNLVKLKQIHLTHNKIDKIEGLDTLVNLEVLSLSRNRIKAIENLANQHNLRELRIYRNRIRSIENISHLSKLSVLSIEVRCSYSVNSSRSISGKPHHEAGELDTLVELEELFVGGQGIETFDGIQKLKTLKVIDAGRNPIASLDHLDNLQQLEELYVCVGFSFAFTTRSFSFYDAMISQWPEVDKMGKLAKLRTVSLKDNPIETRDHDDYGRKVIHALPQVTNVDGTQCR